MPAAAAAASAAAARVGGASGAGVSGVDWKSSELGRIRRGYGPTVAAERLGSVRPARYDARVFLDGRSFLEEQGEAWRQHEHLRDLTDEQLSRPIEAAHGWSGRDLMGRMLVWLSIQLEVARELAVSETSTRSAEVQADWEARGGEVVNAGLLDAWGRLPMSAIRSLFVSVLGELRGTLTVVPETRWLKNPREMDGVMDSTLDHYEEQAGDLEAVLASAG